MFLSYHRKLRTPASVIEFNLCKKKKKKKKRRGGNLHINDSCMNDKAYDKYPSSKKLKRNRYFLYLAYHTRSTTKTSTHTRRSWTQVVSETIGRVLWWPVGVLLGTRIHNKPASLGENTANGIDKKLDI